MISSICMAFLEKINFTQPALMNYFYYFFQGEEYFAHKLWKMLQPWVYPRSFPQKERAAIYNIPIKPCLRSLIQRYSVERIRLNKTWMTLKLTKILVSLLVMNPLKKNDRGSDDMILSFSIKFLLKSCKYWKQLQKLFVLLWKTIVWTLRPLSKY